MSVLDMIAHKVFHFRKKRWNTWNTNSGQKIREDYEAEVRRLFRELNPDERAELFDEIVSSTEQSLKRHLYEMETEQSIKNLMILQIFKLLSGKDYDA